VALAALLLGAASLASLPEAKPCPGHPQGVAEETAGAGVAWRFVATAEAMSSSPASAGDSAPEMARIDASALLLADRRVRQHMAGNQLRGAYTVAQCWVGPRVFVAVGVDSASHAMATHLEQQMRGSSADALKARAIRPIQSEIKPGMAPQERSEINRLLGPAPP
jgi:hypothetical protein